MFFLATIKNKTAQVFLSNKKPVACGTKWQKKEKNQIIQSDCLDIEFFAILENSLNDL